MAVSITWSLSDNGTAETLIDHGAAANGSETTAEEIFLRHDGLNEITGCGFYLAEKSGTYTGDTNATADFSEIIAWGDATPADDWGGVQINMDSEGGFSGGATWGMSESQKTSTDGYKFTCRTGTGDAAANAVTLSEKMSSSMSVDGEIPTAITNVSFQLRVKIPTSESTAGTRQFDQVLAYSFTS